MKSSYSPSFRLQPPQSSDSFQQNTRIQENSWPTENLHKEIQKIPSLYSRSTGPFYHPIPPSSLTPFTVETHAGPNRITVHGEIRQISLGGGRMATGLTRETLRSIIGSTISYDPPDSLAHSSSSPNEQLEPRQVPTDTPVHPETTVPANRAGTTDTIQPPTHKRKVETPVASQQPPRRKCMISAKHHCRSLRRKADPKLSEPRMTRSQTRRPRRGGGRR